MLRLPRRDYYSQVKNWARISYVWTLTSREDSPSRCLACQVDLTVEFVLLHCVSFTNARDNFSVLLRPTCLNCF